MSDLVSKLTKEQTTLLNECKRGIETSKLSLWQLKAELNSIETQLNRQDAKLREAESNYGICMATQRKSMRDLQSQADQFQQFHAKAMLDIQTPWPMLHDLGVAVCIMLGYSDPSWALMRKLLKEHSILTESLKNFAYDNLKPDALSLVGQVRHKHNLHMVSQDSNLPEEIFLFIKWLLSAYNFAIKEQEASNLLKKLSDLAHEKTAVYLQKKETLDAIEQMESRFHRLMTCIESVEKNIKSLRDIKSVSYSSLETLAEECKRTDSLARSSIRIDFLSAHMADTFIDTSEVENEEEAAPSLLVDSLLISRSMGKDYKKELMCFTSPPEDYIEYTENINSKNSTPKSSDDPFSASKNIFKVSTKVDLNDQRDSENSDKLKKREITNGKSACKKSLKRKCCGFV